tara:strand:- start:628 stop:1419 length:792 start_codon:yes stop_codon:yes gene_type:complete
MGLIGKVRAAVYRKWLSCRSLEQLEALLRRRRGVLGLCYHALSEDLGSYPYRTSPEALDAQLTLLSRNFEVVSVEQGVALLKTGAAAQRERPSVMICFDDGYRCNWTQATPVLERHNLPATLFAARDLLRQPGLTYLSEEELGTLARHSLWQVGGHGITHNVLPGLLPEDQSYEISLSKAWLTDLLGHVPSGFAYPQGQVSPSVVQKTRACFDYGLTTDRQTEAGFDLHQIRRFCPMRDHDDLHCFAQALVCAPMEGEQSGLT